jgi:hypothetical protein
MKTRLIKALTKVIAITDSEYEDITEKLDKLANKKRLNEIHWTMPNFEEDYESEYSTSDTMFQEAGVNPPPKDIFIKKMKEIGKVVTFTPEQLKNLNLEHLDFTGKDKELWHHAETPNDIKDQEKEIKYYLKIFDKATSMPMPILMGFNNNKYLVYSGRHRIGYCICRKVKLQAWVIPYLTEVYKRQGNKNSVYGE